MPDQSSQVPSQTADSGSPHSPTELGPPGLVVSLKRAIKEFKVDRGSLVSAGMAFYWFLAIFPAIIAAVGILGLTDVGPDTIANINRAIKTTVPAGAAETLQAIVNKAAKPGGAGGSLLATVFGFALAIWGATAGMVALQRGLDVAYDVEEERTLVASRGNSLVLILLTIALGGTATVLIVFGAALGHGIEGHLPFGGAAFNVGWTIARWVLGLLALSVLFATYYSLGPNRETPRWTWVSPGGIVATVVWLVASVGFSFYTRVGDLDAKYGSSLSGVVALLLWLYLSALAVILGAELNAELERQGAIERKERQSGRRRRRPVSTTVPTATDHQPEPPPAAAPGPPPPAPPAPAPAPKETRPAPERTGSTANGSVQSQWLSYGRSVTAHDREE